MALGKAIEQARLARGWTQPRLSAASGVPVKSINALEKRDSRRSEFAAALAQAMGLSLPDLMAGRVVAAAAVSPVAAAIKGENGLDGIELIERGLRALVIVGRRKDEIMRLVHEAREEAEQYRAAARAEFKRSHPCPVTGQPRGPCPGYVIDHVHPLCAGGPDRPANMQWQTVREAKVKDREERRMCRR